MITPTVNFDPAHTAEFRAAMQEYIASTKRDLSEIVNQRGLNVAGRAFDNTPPETGLGVDAKRKKIRDYMSEPLAQYVRFRKKERDVRARRNIFGPLLPDQGRSENVFVKKLKAGFIKSKGRNRQLRRKHLIAQARAKKEGRKGLYGHEMTYQAGMLARGASAGVGFLKSIFIPAIRALNPHARQKFPWRKTKNIKRWSGSGGWGSAQKAVPGTDPTAVFSVNIRLTPHSAHTAPRVLGILRWAMQLAIIQEAREMRDHVARKLQERANRHMHPSVRKI